MSAPAERSRPLRRLAFRALDVVLPVAWRLPDRAIYRIAFGIGVALSWFMPERRATVRRNLVRVCDWLDERALASPSVSEAVRDPRRMDALVRAAFGHWVVTYAESALAPRYGPDELRARMTAVEPEEAARSIAEPPPGGVGTIQLGMHFGSVDLSGLYATRVAGRRVTAPMEQVADPDARAWFARVRGRLGVTIIPTEGAAARLTDELRRGGMVGLVADRHVGRGRGASVEIFGAPARLPLGPAALAEATGAPIWLQAVERLAAGRWLGHTIPIRAAEGTSGRAAVRSIVEGEARAFERIVARAPEQWTTLFFPIWDDEGRDP